MSSRSSTDSLIWPFRRDKPPPTLDIDVHHTRPKSAIASSTTVMSWAAALDSRESLSTRFPNRLKLNRASVTVLHDSQIPCHRTTTVEDSPCSDVQICPRTTIGSAIGSNNRKHFIFYFSLFIFLLQENKKNHGCNFCRGHSSSSTSLPRPDFHYIPPTKWSKCHNLLNQSHYSYTYKRRHRLCIYSNRFCSSTNTGSVLLHLQLQAPSLPTTTRKMVSDASPIQQTRIRLTISHFCWLHYDKFERDVGWIHISMFILLGYSILLYLDIIFYTINIDQILPTEVFQFLLFSIRISI